MGSGQARIYHMGNLGSCPGALEPIDKFLTRFRFTSLTPPVYAFHFRFGGLRFMLLGISDIVAETDAPD